MQTAQAIQTNAKNMQTIFTIGHAAHPIEKFLRMLDMQGITALCDVRSSPYSRFNPQFNREVLQRVLKKEHVTYVYLGKELGPRSDDPDCYEQGKVRYDRIARTQLFNNGLQRLKEGINLYRIALMCAEKDPLACHRMILICRYLRSPDLSIRHILEDGSLEDNAETERRLLKLLNISEPQLFETPEELINQAYQIQSGKIAYARDPVQDEYRNVAPLI